MNSSTSVLPPESSFTMPAEWEKQEGILLSYPLNPATWVRNHFQMEEAYIHFAAEISHYERVWINCVSSEQSMVAYKLDFNMADMDNITFLDIATNDAWCRDHGPVRLIDRATSERAFIDFSYNAWGGKFSPWELDDAVPRKVAQKLGLKCFKSPFVCEGGALESNGKGTLLTTRSVMLNPNRNANMTESRAEEFLCECLGMKQILWLDSGLYCDDTDGHIDTLTRFVSENTVATCVEKNPESPDYETLAKNLETLKNMRLIDGAKLNIIELPLPEPIIPDDWREEMLPATYANFLIINGAVLVPSYRQAKKDSLAAGIIGDAFPGRKIISIDCSDIILEGGALHCLSRTLIQQDIA